MSNRPRSLNSQYLNLYEKGLQLVVWTCAFICFHFSTDPKQVNATTKYF
nr:MAG TPA: hypothetical protein [Caudoviricetes sp.]